MEKMQPKKRGRPPTGKGIPVQVRLQEDLYDALDNFASATGITRPQVIKQIFTLWAESADLIDNQHRENGAPVVVMLPRETFQAFCKARTECFPQSVDRGSAVADMLAEWLKERHYLPG
jgi:hypothetical protein